MRVITRRELLAACMAGLRQIAPLAEEQGRTIAELGFTGYIAHEFEPTRDALTSLREAVPICDV